MKTKSILTSILETGLVEDVLLCPEKLSSIAQEGNDIVFSYSLSGKRPIGGLLYFDEDEQTSEKLFFWLRFYGDPFIRLQISSAPQEFKDDNPMLAFYPAIRAQALELSHEDGSNGRFGL